jgi:HEAT repeat protein
MTRKPLNQELISLLAPVEITEETISRIRDMGPDIIADLMDIMASKPLAMPTAPGKGQVPANAAEVLGELQAVEAIEPMLRLLEDCSEDGNFYYALKFALLAIGQPIIEPAIKVYYSTSRVSVRWAIAYCLALLEIQSPTILAVLLHAFRNDPDFDSTLFADYGDPGVIPELSAALDKCKATGDFVADRQILDLAHSITKLDGHLSASQVALVGEALESNKKPTLGMLNRICGIFTEPSRN